MSVFRMNAKKVSQDFGSVSKMARAYNIAQPTLEHIIYRKPSLNFRKDSVREAVNDLLAKGYLFYADEVEAQKSSTPKGTQELGEGDEIPPHPITGRTCLNCIIKEAQ